MRINRAALLPAARIAGRFAYLTAFALAMLFLLATRSSAKDFRILHHHLIEGVPYVQQSHPNTCGAAALAMLLSFQEGGEITEDDILALHPEIRERGFWVPHLWVISESRGHATLHGEGTVEKLKNLILQGSPTIVYQFSNPTGRPHFRVVTGFDDSRCVFVVHDPAEELGENYEMSYDLFTKLWRLAWYTGEDRDRYRFYFAIVDRPPA